MAKIVSSGTKGHLLSLGALLVSTATFIVLIWPSARLPCDQYVAARGLTAGCNAKTAPGYYWQRQQRLSGYFEHPFKASPVTPECSAKFRNRLVGQATYYPSMTQFTPIASTYAKPDDASLENYMCNTMGDGKPASVTPEQAAACGLWEFVCQEQMPDR